MLISYGEINKMLMNFLDSLVRVMGIGLFSAIAWTAWTWGR